MLSSDTSNDQVILVDQHDQEMGLTDKLAAHQHGQLHRAISVVIFRQQDGQLQTLLQQRASHKYHSANLWSNTCCSHPRPSESTLASAERRLQEEMGMKGELTHCGSFIYRAELENGLVEHELDHVFCGTLEAPCSFTINPDEAQDAKWVAISELQQDLDKHPERYSSWLKQVLEIAVLTRQEPPHPVD